jgi:GNAT superfamily N-acetyltransferase
VTDRVALRLHEHATANASVRAWLEDRLPASEFAVQLAVQPTLVAEVVDGAGDAVAVAVGNDRATTLSGATQFLAVIADDEAAGDALVPTVRRQVEQRGACELLGPGDLPERLAATVAERVGGTAELIMQQRLWATRAVRSPRGVPGSPRAGRREERVLLAGWLDDFSSEALAVPPQGPDAWLEQVADAGASLQVWDVDGEPVSLVYGHRTTAVSSRIGPVWTPPEHRGHGYAAALTAHVTLAGLVSGDRRVVLLTDVRNAVSNRLYARIGYEEVCPHASWVVRGPGPIDAA